MIVDVGGELYIEEMGRTWSTKARIDDDGVGTCLLVFVQLDLSNASLPVSVSGLWVEANT